LFSPTYDEIIFLTWPLREQDAEALVGGAAVVRHDRQVLDLAPRQLADAVLGVPGQAEAAGQDDGAVGDVGERRLGIGEDLVHRRGILEARLGRLSKPRRASPTLTTRSVVPPRARLRVYCAERWRSSR
jgi:hypothetical protein